MKNWWWKSIFSFFGFIFNPIAKCRSMCKFWPCTISWWGPSSQWQLVGSNKKPNQNNMSRCLLYSNIFLGMGYRHMYYLKLLFQIQNSSCYYKLQGLVPGSFIFHDKCQKEYYGRLHSSDFRYLFSCQVLLFK